MANIETIGSGNSAIETNSAQAMSQQVFGDPQAFLAALKADFSTLDVTRTGEIDKKTLGYVAEHDKDQAVRQVAQTALTHFDDIQAFRDDLPRHAVRGHADGLTLNDIQLVDDAVHNSPQAYIDRDKDYYRSEIKWDIGLGAAWGLLTAAEVAGQNYWFAGLTGALAAEHAISAVNDYDKIDSDGPVIATKFVQERDAVSHWKEFTH